MSLGKNLEAQYLNNTFGGTAITAPTTISIGLCTGVTDAGVITGEPSGNGYSRVSVANNATNWPAATVVGNNTVKRNGTVIQFPTATESWGTLTHWFAMNGSTYLAGGPLSEQKTVPANDTASFAANTLEIRLD